MINFRRFWSEKSVVLGLLAASVLVSGCKDAEFIDLPLIQPSALPSILPTHPPSPRPSPSPTPSPTPSPSPSPTPSPTPSPSPSPSPTPSPTPRPGSIYGKVTNAINGNPLENVDIRFRLNGTLVRESFTTRNGDYTSGPMPAGNYSVSYELDGFSPLTVPIRVPAGQAIQANEALSPLIDASEWRVVLTWTDEREGAVRDVDSYLLEPGSDFPIGYPFDRKIGLTANLDHDETNWSGPETITITNMAMTGTYIYYVNNYSSRPGPFGTPEPLALGKSDIRIVVYRGNTVLRQFTINGGSGYTYEVFRIVNGTFTVTGSQRYNESLTVY